MLQGCGSTFPALSLFEGVLWRVGHRLWRLYYGAGGWLALLCRSLAPWPRVQILAVLAGAAQLAVRQQHFVVAALAGPF